MDGEISVITDGPDIKCILQFPNLMKPRQKNQNRHPSEVTDFCQEIGRGYLYTEHSFHQVKLIGTTVRF